MKAGELPFVADVGHLRESDFRHEFFEDTPEDAVNRPEERRSPDTVHKVFDVVIRDGCGGRRQVVFDEFTEPFDDRWYEVGGIIAGERNHANVLLRCWVAADVPSQEFLGCDVRDCD